MTEHNTKIKLEFTVFGDLLDPLNFSKKIKLNPSNYWYKEDLIKKNNPNLRRKETAWEYVIDWIETLDIEDCTNAFIKTFSAKVILIQEYIRAHHLEAKIDFVIKVYNDNSPAIYFNRPFLNLINILEAEIDIDLYYINS